MVSALSDMAAELQVDGFATIPPGMIGDYPDIRKDYQGEIYDAVYGYLRTAGSVTRWRNLARKAVVDFFPQAFYTGYTDAGGEETDAQDERWLTNRQAEELAHVDEMFDALKAQKDAHGGYSYEEADPIAQRHADGYANGLDGVYTYGKLLGAKNIMLTMVGEDGQENCPDCRRRKGMRKSARWWVANGIPGIPGTPFYKCKGYNCQHYLEDDKGNVFQVNEIG
jgi:hypothetical protein